MSEPHNLKVGGFTLRQMPTVTLPKDKLERVLRVLERANTMARACHMCGARGTVHKPDCELAASIADLKEAL